MRLGHQGAAARGLPVIPAFLILMVLGIWLVSASITAVGVISFIGLLTPNIASGITAAAIGAPALIWFSRRQLKAQDTLTISLPQSRASLSRVTLLGLLLMMLAALGLHTLFQMNELSWQLDQWSLRWPRMLTALCAGIGLALAGSILQRLIYNPLASPDILGVSSGATFALVFANLFLGQSLLAAHWVTALLGSLLVLAA